MRRPSAPVDARWRRALFAAVGAMLAAAGGVALLALVSGMPPAADADALTPAERTAILALGPWPPAPIRDPANPASGQAAGIALGETLFYSPRLSPSGLRCATCHEPWRHFADGRVVALGAARGARNTPSLLDAARHRRFGWDGARDALWLQSLRPMDDPREMPASAAQIAAWARGDAALAARFAAVFGAPFDADDARVTRVVGLALAAYVETLATPRAPFDDWRDRLASASSTSEPAATDAFPAAARRGLRLFVGRAGCSACHAGAMLSDDAFHVSLVHSLAASGRPDTGRPGTPPNAFRTPALRGVADTAPYLHDGSAARLCDAVLAHATDGGSLPPALSTRDRRDLVAFLRALSADPPPDDCHD